MTSHNIRDNPRRQHDATLNRRNSNATYFAVVK